MKQRLRFCQENKSLSLLYSIGLLATVGALTLGLRAMNRGDKWQSQMMMRYDLKEEIFIHSIVFHHFRARIGYVSFPVVQN